MGQHLDKVRLLTWDAGALYLAGVADELQAQLDSLKARVDTCCTSALAAPKAEPVEPSSALKSAGAPSSAPTNPTPDKG